MLEIKKLEVSPISKSEFAISWDYEPMIESLSDYEITIEKSEAPHDGYDFLAKANPRERYFIDSDVAIFKFWKNYYVRLKIKNLVNSEVAYSSFATVEHPPNLEAIELIRRTKLSLENARYGNGVLCSVYIRKESGQRCRECFDEIKRRSTKSNCINCFGTSYDGGFYLPINAHINFSPDAKSMGIIDSGNAVNSANRAMMGNYPKLKPGDLVADARLNRIWQVGDTNQIERKRHLIKQIATLTEEDRTSVVYELLKRDI